MQTVGTILKLQTESTGTIFYQIDGSDETSYIIKPLCRVRKGYLTIKYENVLGSRIYKSEVGVHYRVANKKEVSRIRDIIDQACQEIVKGL